MSLRDLFGKLGCKLGLQHDFEYKAVKRFGKMVHFRVCYQCDLREFWSTKLSKWVK